MGRYASGRSEPAGFSLLEVLVVVAIGMIITAVGLPIMSNAIAMTKLRSSMTSVSGLLQNARMAAVQQNKTKTSCHYNWTMPAESLVYFAKDAVDCTTNPTVVVNDPQVELQAPIYAMATPTGPNAPSAIPNATLGLTANPLTSDPSFNSRGLPCAYSSGNCTGNAFIQYFKDNRFGGSGGWAAISISPAGRINRWFWNGSTWSN